MALQVDAAEQPVVVLAGGSGFLGQALAIRMQAAGSMVVVLTRGRARSTGAVDYVHWDGRTVGAWADRLNGADAVINLTGRNVNCRYTPATRREIVESRVDSVKAIDSAILRCAAAPRVVVQAASLAIYGDAGDQICDESAPPGSGFPVETCLLWEQAFNAGQTPSTRRVLLRIGFVLGREGGVLPFLSRLARWFLGGSSGNGRQYISWIHLEDLLHIFERVIGRDDDAGVLNATGPSPVTNAVFMRELRRAVGRPWSPPVPALAVRVGAFVMRTEAVLALTGRRCVPRRLQEDDFTFRFPRLDDALADLLGPRRARSATAPGMRYN